MRLTAEFQTLAWGERRVYSTVRYYIQEMDENAKRSCLPHGYLDLLVCW